MTEYETFLYRDYYDDVMWKGQMVRRVGIRKKKK